MMRAGWGSFPWPVLFVIPMIAMAGFMMLRTAHGHRGVRPGCGNTGRSRPTRQSVPSAPESVDDPIVILRERFARGKIDLDELEARLDGLLRSDPSESIPRHNDPARPEPPRSTR
jgi:uncharacterized membrane protein